jgi:hypothetical protein
MTTLALVVAVVALVLPAIGSAWVVQTYKQDTYLVGGIWSTSGSPPAFANRAFNRVWHEAGYEWGVSYCYSVDTSNCTWWWFTSSNPTVDDFTGSANNARARCNNVDDNSGTMWTCQTSKPS